MFFTLFLMVILKKVFNFMGISTLRDEMQHIFQNFIFTKLQIIKSRTLRQFYALIKSVLILLANVNAATSTVIISCNPPLSAISIP